MLHRDAVRTRVFVSTCIVGLIAWILWAPACAGVVTETYQLDRKSGDQRVVRSVFSVTTRTSGAEPLWVRDYASPSEPAEWRIVHRKNGPGGARENWRWATVPLLAHHFVILADLDAYPDATRAAFAERFLEHIGSSPEPRYPEVVISTVLEALMGSEETPTAEAIHAIFDRAIETHGAE